MAHIIGDLLMIGGTALMGYGTYFASGVMQSLVFVISFSTGVIGSTLIIMKGFR